MTCFVFLWCRLESQVIYLFFCIIFPIECQESSKQQGFTDPVDQRWSFTDHWLWYGEKVWSQLVILGTVFVTVRITESVPLCTVRCIKLTPKTRDTAGRKLFYSCIKKKKKLFQNSQSHKRKWWLAWPKLFQLCAINLQSGAVLLR